MLKCVENQSAACQLTGCHVVRSGIQLIINYCAVKELLSYTNEIKLLISIPIMVGAQRRSDVALLPPDGTLPCVLHS